MIKASQLELTAVWFATCIVASTAARSQAPSSSPNVVTYVATEYAFSGPAEIPAGLTTVRMVNRGTEVHWMETFKLAPAKTVSDLLAAIADSESGFQPPHSWTTATGGPGWIGPGEMSDLTAYLKPGHYVLICRFRTAEGVQHVKKGMLHALTVTATAGAPAAEPHADLTIGISDSAFRVPVPILAGMHTVRVDNEGSYRHELYILRLAPGKSIEDYWAWERGGLTAAGPPGRPFGGVTPFEPRTHVWFTATFEPGKYVFGDESGEGKEIFRQVSVR